MRKGAEWALTLLNDDDDDDDDDGPPEEDFSLPAMAAKWHFEFIIRYIFRIFSGRT